MVFAYVGVAAVVGILIGLVTLSVMWVARTVGESIRRRSMSLLNGYDSLLDERSRELRAADRELQHRREELAQAEQLEAAPEEAVQDRDETGGTAATALLRVMERAGTTAYRETGSGPIYRMIRSAFDAQPEQVLRQLPIRLEGRCPGAAAELLEKLSFDTIYALSTLPGEQQYKLLQESLPEQARPLLEEFTAAHSSFDCISFYDELQALAALEPGPVRLRVAPHTSCGALPDGVRLVEDDEICEGFQIEADNVLYDYCVRMEEIG